MDHRYHRVQWGPLGLRSRTSKDTWRQPLKWDRAAKQGGVRRKVFCASLADVFEDKPEIVEWRKDLFTLIDQTDSLDWLLLTKRPENVINMVCDFAGDIEWLNSGAKSIWIGTTVENQAMADKRIPELMKIPAKVKFLSCEPLLGSVNLGLLGTVPFSTPYSLTHQHIDWVIAGGESGTGARPMNEEWPLWLRDQCEEAGVKFFFKQWGAHGGDPSQHNGGCLLDGREYKNFPIEGRYAN